MGIYELEKKKMDRINTAYERVLIKGKLYWRVGKTDIEVEREIWGVESFFLSLDVAADIYLSREEKFPGSLESCKRQYIFYHAWLFTGW